jgi:hypothetical protein
MKSKDIAREYVNNFRRHLSHFLKPGMSLRSEIILVKDGGGIVRFSFTTKGSEDNFRPIVKTMPEALKTFEIKNFGDGQGFVFSGTNMVLEGDSIYLIKGEEISVWSDEGAKEDVNRILDAARKHSS